MAEMARHRDCIYRRRMAVSVRVAATFWAVCAMAEQSAAEQVATFELLTKEQYAAIEQSRTAYASGEKPLACSSRASSDRGPDITVESPDLARAVVSPFDLRVLFTAASDAEVKTDTLKVCVVKWSLSVDVTDTVLKHARVSSAGIVSTGTVLRSGEYDIILLLADSKQRVTRKQFAIQVGSKNRQ